jgi:hypothetical protein
MTATAKSVGRVNVRGPDKQEATFVDVAPFAESLADAPSVEASPEASTVFSGPVSLPGVADLENAPGKDEALRVPLSALLLALGVVRELFESAELAVANRNN